MLFMRDPSRAFAVAWLGCLVAACSFTSSGSGGPGSTPVVSSSSSIPTAGHPSTPQEIDCNGASVNGTELCSPPTAQACCTNGTSTGQCQPEGTTTCNGANQWLFECDENADCTNNQLCCLTGNTFSCQPNCPAQQQSCRLNSDCGVSGTCLVQLCNGNLFAELCQLGNGCTQQ